VTTPPLVSLIMPVWNPHPLWFPEAVESALAQEGCTIELIVIDDGCPTPAAELLDGIDDDRLRLIRVPHGRVSRARNAGIALAQGAFIRFVDCDDVILPRSTARLVELAGREGSFIAYGATQVCDDRMAPVSLIATDDQGWVAEQCLLNRFATTIHSLLFPRWLVDEIGPWEPSIVVSQDWDYALRAFERLPVRGDREIATRYRLHPEMNSRDVEQGIRGYELVVARYFQRHPEQRGTRLHRRAVALYHLFAAVQLSTQLRRHRAALAHLVRGLGRDAVATIGGLPRHGATPFHPSLRRLGRRLRTARS
jgi:glycosyltransferase involved in cell wall biosynthesis